MLPADSENTCTIHVYSDYDFYSNIGNNDEATVSFCLFLPLFSSILSSTLRHLKQWHYTLLNQTSYTGIITIYCHDDFVYNNIELLHFKMDSRVLLIMD